MVLGRYVSDLRLARYLTCSALSISFALSIVLQLYSTPRVKSCMMNESMTGSTSLTTVVLVSSWEANRFLGKSGEIEAEGPSCRNFSKRGAQSSSKPFHGDQIKKLFNR